MFVPSCISMFIFCCHDSSCQKPMEPRTCLRQVATTAQSASAAKRKVTLMPKETPKTYVDQQRSADLIDSV